MKRWASGTAVIAGAGLFFGFGTAVPASGAVFQVNRDGTVILLANGGMNVVADGLIDVSGDPAEEAPEMPAEALTPTASPNVPAEYREVLLRTADRYAVSPSLLAALAHQESRWRQSAVSPKGAIGLTQLMPPTARELAVDPHDPVANLDGGARYLRSLLNRFDGDVERALAAYNAGPGRVLKANGVPAIAETRAYVTTIIDYLGERTEPMRRIGK